MQHKKQKGGDHSPSQHQQPKAPQQQAQGPQHHNSVIGLHTRKQQVKELKNAQELNAVARRPGQ